MQSWNVDPYDHKRSASIAGFSGSMNQDYDNARLGAFKTDYRAGSQHYASYMDLNRPRQEQIDGGQKYYWRPQASNTDFHKRQAKQPQQSFISTFKDAINKMKAESISRLNEVDNLTTNDSPDFWKIPDTYNRQFQTLQPQKIMTDLPAISRPNHQIFRCSITGGGGRDRISSTSSHPLEYASSEAKSDNTEKDNQYQSISSLHSLYDKYQNIVSTNGESFSTNEPSISCFSSSKTIPKSMNQSRLPKINKSSNVPKVCISEKKILTLRSAPRNSINPKPEMIMQPKYEPTDCVLKQITSNYERNNATRSNSNRRPLKNASEKMSEGFIMSSQGESVCVSPKELPGFYKKSNQSPLKAKSISNMPNDFKKLHSAFLEQKREIKSLKLELEEKKSYIIQLESEIRSYEPWR